MRDSRRREFNEIIADYSSETTYLIFKRLGVTATALKQIRMVIGLR